MELLAFIQVTGEEQKKLKGQIAEARLLQAFRRIERQQERG